MTLLELEPRFIKIIDETTSCDVDDIKEADSVVFSCPECYRKNNNSLVGVHSILCHQPHVPNTKQPRPGRWFFEGSGLQDLTLRNASSSIFLQGDCKAHFWITNGQIKFA